MKKIEKHAVSTKLSILTIYPYQDIYDFIILSRLNVSNTEKTIMMMYDNGITNLSNILILMKLGYCLF